jgi:N-acetylmuramoyl-L-alanine amidase
MGSHVVEQGECLSSIAAAHGFDWKALWDHPNNADLKQKRKDPNILFPGDVVFVPEKKIKQEELPVGARHKFVLKGGSDVLRIKLLDGLDQPQAHLEYELVLDGNSRMGHTNEDGELSEVIPRTVRSAKLILPGPDGPQEISVRIGTLDPADTISGAQARLTNLGFDSGAPDGIEGPKTEAAVRAFQDAFGLEPTGQLDDETMAKLKERYGR